MLSAKPTRLLKLGLAPQCLNEWYSDCLEDAKKGVKARLKED